MTTESILTAASGGQYFESGTYTTGSFMAFKAINADAVIVINGDTTNIRGIAGKEITILQGDILWCRAVNFTVTGEVIAYDLN